LEENPDEPRAIINKVVLALKARKAAKAAKDSVLRKGALEGMTLPGKLAGLSVQASQRVRAFHRRGRFGRWYLQDRSRQKISGDTSTSWKNFKTLNARVSTECWSPSKSKISSWP